MRSESNGVALICIDRSGKLLVHLRTLDAPTMGGEWCLVGGAIEPNETAAKAAIRELHEETGISSESIEFYKEIAFQGKQISLFIVRFDSNKSSIVIREGRGLVLLRPDEALELIKWINVGRTLNPFLEVLRNYILEKGDSS